MLILYLRRIMIVSTFKMYHGGRLGGSAVERLPLAQGMILGFWDQVLHWAACEEPLLPLPMSLPLCLS